MVMKRIANKNILSVKPYVPGKPIEEVKRELGLKNVIKLASNENPYGPSARVLTAIRQAARQVNRYPDGACYYLGQELAKKLGVSQSQLIFGNGSDEILVLAVRAFVSPGEEVVVARPSFLVYDIASRLAGAKVKAVPLEGFRYNLPAMKKAVGKKTKIVFIGNPDNPAGTYVTRDEVQKFFKGLRQDVVVIFDEAYFEYIDSKDYPDTLNLLKKHKNIIVTRTFSKMYALAGLRIGYGIADPEIISLLNRLREPFNVNSVAQAAALAALKDSRYYRKLAGKFKQQREYLYKNLARVGLRYQKSAANFILVDVKKDSTQVAKQLLKKGVIVRDMSFWKLKGFIRITVGTQQENKKLISTLEEVI